MIPNATHSGYVTGLVCTAFLLTSCATANRSSLSQILGVGTMLTETQHDTAAEQYREKAAEARRLAATHEAMAAQYRSWSNGDAAAQKTADEMTNHCQVLARDYEDAANRYDALAAGHASLAEGWRKGEPPRGQDDRRL